MVGGGVLPNEASPAVGERVRVRVGLAAVEGRVVDVYESDHGPRVVVETDEDDSPDTRRTVAVPPAMIIQGDEDERQQAKANPRPRQRGRGRGAIFVLKRGESGKFHFNLVAETGRVLATSQDYETKEAAVEALQSAQGAEAASTR
jgi:uncharacterized protein